MASLTRWMLVLLAAIPLVVGGCAARCKRVADVRAEIDARRATADPHLRIVVPHVVTQGEVIKRLRRKGATRVKLPSIPGIGRSLGEVRIRVEAVVLTEAGPGHVGFRVRLGVLQGRRSIGGLDLDAQVRPDIDIARGTVRVALRPDDIRSVEPKLSRGSAHRLASAVHEQLPAAAKMLISRGDLATFAAQALRELVRRSWPTLRRELLADLGDIASLELDLPDLPLRSVDVASSATAIELSVITSLPVGEGVAASAVPTPGDHALITLSGAALAELANYAMDRGELPDRFDESGSPNDNGPLRPTLGWVSGPRPLKAHVFDERDDCLYLRLAATPKATVQGKTIAIAVDDGVIETVHGPAKLKLLAWSQRMGKNALAVTETIASSLQLELAGERIPLRVQRIAQTREQVVVGLSLGG